MGKSISGDSSNDQSKENQVRVPYYDQLMAAL